jgi:hypothetical protein
MMGSLWRKSVIGKMVVSAKCQSATLHTNSTWGLVEGHADPLLLAPDDVTGYVRSVCLKDKVERPAPALIGIAVGHFFAHRLDKAAAMLLLSLEENPSWPPCYRFLASCYAHLGRLDDARIKRLGDITPIVVPSAAHWRIPKQREFYLEDLRLAAGEMK